MNVSQGELLMSERLMNVDYYWDVNVIRSKLYLSGASPPQDSQSRS